MKKTILFFLFCFFIGFTGCSNDILNEESESSNLKLKSLFDRTIIPVRAFHTIYLNDDQNFYSATLLTRRTFPVVEISDWGNFIKKYWKIDGSNGTISIGEPGFNSQWAIVINFCKFIDFQETNILNFFDHRDGSIFANIYISDTDNYLYLRTENNPQGEYLWDIYTQDHTHLILVPDFDNNVLRYTVGSRDLDRTISNANYDRMPVIFNNLNDFYSEDGSFFLGLSIGGMYDEFYLRVPYVSSQYTYIGDIQFIRQDLLR